MSKTAVVKWHPKIARLRQSVEKRSEMSDIFVTPSFTVDYINTGSTVLNLLIGGSRLDDGKFVCPGYPKGTIIEIFGRESSGKSTIALTAMGQALAQNGGTGCGLYVDLECAVKDYYATKLGVDFRSPELGGSGQAIRAQPHSFEETEALVMQAVQNGVDLIVIDSVAGLVSRREQARDTSDKEQKLGVAEIPRLMSNWLPKLQGACAASKSTVIFLNQMRDKIGAKGFSEEALKSTTGGNALKYWSSIRMMLKPRMSTKAKIFNPIVKAQEDVQIATDVEIKMIKNKIDAKQGHSGLITIRYGVGIDELRTMMNVAEAYSIVKKSKNGKKQDVYTFKSPSSGKVLESTGLEKFRLMLLKTDGGAPMTDMIELCTDRIMQGFRMLDDEQLAALEDNAVAKRIDDDDDDDIGDPPIVVRADDDDEELGVNPSLDMENV